MGILKYTGEAISRNYKRFGSAKIEEGIELAEKKIWDKLKGYIIAGLSFIGAYLWMTFKGLWFAFALLNPAVAIAVYTVLAIALVATILYVVLPYFRSRWRAYNEAVAVREDFEKMLKEYDNEFGKDTKRSFEHLADADYHQAEIADLFKELNKIYEASAKKYGLNPGELIELSSHDQHYQKAKGFLYTAQKLYFDNKFEIEELCSEGEVGELFDILSDMDTKQEGFDFKVISNLSGLFENEGLANDPALKKLLEKGKRAEIYDVFNHNPHPSLRLVNGSKQPFTPKLFLLMIKLALNELYVSQAVKEGRFADILNEENTTLSSHTLSRALKYKQALFGEISEPRHKLLGQVFFNKTTHLSDNELEFIYCVMDKVHRGKLHWHKKNNDSFCRESYIDLIDNYSPKRQSRLDDSLETYINVIQRVDEMLPVLDGIDVETVQRAREARALPHNEAPAPQANDAPIPVANIAHQYEDEEGEGEHPTI